LHHFFHGTHQIAFKEATTLHEILEILNDFRAVNVMEGMRNFAVSFFVDESESAHGTINERIARIERARIRHVKVTRRNKPRGSFAK
jgi:hypothetical protein